MTLLSDLTELENIGTLVIPDQMAVSKAHEAFADDDTLKDAKRAASIQQMTSRFVHVVARLGDR
jgi:hypothetical protein